MKHPVATLTLAASVLLGSTYCSLAGEKAAPRFTFETDTLTLAKGEVEATVISVDQLNGAVKKPLLNIPNAAGKFTALQRAEVIRQRAEDATAVNPTWYDQLQCKLDPSSGDWVVTGPVFAAKAEPLVTLDKAFLKRLKAQNDLRTNSLAAECVKEEIMDTLDPQTAHQHGLGRDLLDSHFKNAVEHAKLGTYYFNEYTNQHLRNRLGIAISEYKSAIDENPHNVFAMEQLAELDKISGQTAEADYLTRRIASINMALPELNKGNDALPEKVDGVSTNDKNLDDIPKLNTAIEHYKNAIATFNGCISFHVILSDCYQSLADIERNNGHADAAKQDSALEMQVLKAIPAEVLQNASTPFKVYVENRLETLAK